MYIWHILPNIGSIGFTFKQIFINNTNINILFKKLKIFMTFQRVCPNTPTICLKNYHPKTRLLLYCMILDNFEPAYYISSLKQNNACY